MSRGTRHDPIFRHKGNARAGASVILIGALAALIGSVFMVIGPRFKQEPRPPRDAFIGGSSAPVRVIGHAPRENGPCERQVWPNIDQHCLVRTEAKPNSGNTSSPEQNDKLSPATASAITDRQSFSQDATKGSTPYYASAPAPSEKEAFNVARPSDVTVDPSIDNGGELRQQEPTESPRKRARRHYRPFHFGAFRF
jgi:hypothetical protein